MVAVCFHLQNKRVDGERLDVPEILVRLGIKDLRPVGDQPQVFVYVAFDFQPEDFAAANKKGESIMGHSNCVVLTEETLVHTYHEAQVADSMVLLACIPGSKCCHGF